MKTMKQQLKAMSPQDQLAIAEQARAACRKMVASGDATLDPDTVKAMRRLDKEIAATRKHFGMKGA